MTESYILISTLVYSFCTYKYPHMVSPLCPSLWSPQWSFTENFSAVSIVTGICAGWLGFDSQQGSEGILSLYCIHSLGPILPPVQWVLVALSLRITSWG